MKKDLRLVHQELKNIDDFADELTISLFGPEFKERERINRIEKAIALAKETIKLKREIIDLSTDDPRFLYELKKVLDRLRL